MTNLITPAGTIKQNVLASMLQLKRPGMEDTGGPSGFDEDYLALIAEDYEYFVVPDAPEPDKKTLDRTLARVRDLSRELRNNLRHPTGHLASTFYASSLKEYDKHRPSLGELMRTLERLETSALPSGPRNSGPRPADRALKVALHAAVDFAKITRSEPSFSKERGLCFRVFLGQVFRALSIKESADTFARKAIGLRRSGGELSE